jgi:cell wall-associated NlpC family hydrolase
LRFRATLALVLLSSPAAAQGPGFEVGRYWANPAVATYRLGWSFAVLGPLGGDIHGAFYNGPDPIGNLWGGGLDVSLFRSGSPGVYGIGGVEGGLVTQGTRTFWGSWSVGMGYELIPFRGLSLAAEGRYRVTGKGGYDGLELGLRLGYDRGPRRSRPSGGDPARPSALPPPMATGNPDSGAEADAARERLRADGVPDDRAAVLGSVVQTALDVMGMPYRWGDQGDEGFDCSGLIRYAFGQHGIALPRRSADQAREGQPVAREVDSLRPGDVLTFATSGSERVSHVGLYIGNRRFIHSATGGVQISVLSPDDVAGRWWWRRWVGVRRMVG